MTPDVDPRPTRVDLLMDTAELWAKRSTCARMSVGAVIHSDGRILVQGYNGSPAGLPHCDHKCTCNHQRLVRMYGHEESCLIQPQFCKAVHAEQSAIAWAARAGVRLEQTGIVCTHQPCLSCARSIINAGINSVIFKEPYRLRDGLELLLEAHIWVRQFVDYGKYEGV